MVVFRLPRPLSTALLPLLLQSSLLPLPYSPFSGAHSSPCTHGTMDFGRICGGSIAHRCSVNVPGGRPMDAPTAPYRLPVSPSRRTAMRNACCRGRTSEVLPVSFAPVFPSVCHESSRAGSRPRGTGSAPMCASVTTCSITGRRSICSFSTTAAAARTRSPSSNCVLMRSMMSRGTGTFTLIRVWPARCRAASSSRCSAAAEAAFAALDCSDCDDGGCPCGCLKTESTAVAPFFNDVNTLAPVRAKTVATVEATEPPTASSSSPYSNADLLSDEDAPAAAAAPTAAGADEDTAAATLLNLLLLMAAFAKISRRDESPTASFRLSPACSWLLKLVLMALNVAGVLLP